ncbi:Cytochrome P450 superfamily protein [Abortiporus biennis]
MVSTLRDAFLAIVLSAVIVHLIFRRYEPTHTISLLALLLVYPTFLSVLLWSWLPVASTFATFYITLSLSIFTYRLSPLHPLSQYPGPVLCKLSKLCLYVNSRNGKQHLYIQSLHQKYGDIVRIGPNELSISDPNAILPVLGTYGVPRSSVWAARSLFPPVDSLLAIRDPGYHHQRRRPWSRALNTLALKDYEHPIRARVTQLANSILGSCQQSTITDLSDWMCLFTYDVMSDVVFGGGSEMMKEGDNDGFRKVLDTGMRSVMIFEQMPWLAQISKNLSLPVVGEGIARLRRVGAERASSRARSGSTRKDLYFYLSHDDKPEIPAASTCLLIAEGALATIAGSDTTSSVLSNIFYFLMRNPLMYKRLQEEVDKFYPSGSDPADGVHYKEMVYLDAVINETLRLYPPLLSGSSREIPFGSGGRLIGNHYIPEGTHIRIHTYTLHRDPRNFSPYPEHFWPDRWLQTPSSSQLSTEDRHDHDDIQLSENINHNTEAFIPFSFGPSNCVGKNLAWMEMRMVVCTLVQKMRFEFGSSSISRTTATPFTHGGLPGEGQWEVEEWENSIRDEGTLQRGYLPVIVSRRSTSM